MRFSWCVQGLEIDIQDIPNVDIILKAILYMQGENTPILWGFHALKKGREIRKEF